MPYMSCLFRNSSRFAMWRSRRRSAFLICRMMLLPCGAMTCNTCVRRCSPSV